MKYIKKIEEYKKKSVYIKRRIHHIMRNIFREDKNENLFFLSLYFPFQTPN